MNARFEIDSDALTDLAGRLARYEAAKRRAVDWLLRQVNPDGSIGPAATQAAVTYYRVPWALAVAGEAAAASRLLAWIEANALDPQGSFRGAGPKPAPNRETNGYAETCLAYGAHLLRRLDIARRAMDAALRTQDPETGGVWMDETRSGPDGPQVLFLTAQLGMSAALTGRLDAALAAGRWLRRLWDAQPELPDRLYTIWTRAGGLATTVPPGEDARHYVNESQEIRQFHYNGGIAAACMAHLYAATGEATWVELAGAYQTFSLASTPRQFEVRQVCKSAWGAGLLYLLTRERPYLAWAAKMGDWFVEVQEPDGSWVNSAYIDPDPPLERRVEITAEFVVHLDTVIQAIAAAQE